MPVMASATPPSSWPVMVAPDGLLVVDKPTRLTSHDVVARVRRLAATRKIGHAGTLDPLATGVLVVGIGRATRLLGHLALKDKAYHATIRLGQSTVSDDADGDFTASRDAGNVSDAELVDAVASLTGELQQVPAAVSAVRVDGQRAYARVRAGQEVALAARTVQVSSFEIREVRRLGPVLDVDVMLECSTGTYVRALARDLGNDLGVGGHLTALRRTRVGPFADSVAHSLDALGELLPEDLPVMPLDEAAAACFPTYNLDEEIVQAVRNGRRIAVDLRSDDPVAVLTAAGEFLGLYQQDGSTARAVAVFART